MMEFLNVHVIFFIYYTLFIYKYIKYKETKIFNAIAGDIYIDASFAMCVLFSCTICHYNDDDEDFANVCREYSKLI